MDKDIKTLTQVLGSLEFFWVMINFTVGLFVYGNFEDGLMLSVLAFEAEFISLLFAIPFICFIFFPIALIMGWGTTLIDILELPLDLYTGFAFLFPAILLFIMGCIFTLGAISTIMSSSNSRSSIDIVR